MTTTRFGLTLDLWERNGPHRTIVWLRRSRAFGFGVSVNRWTAPSPGSRFHTHPYSFVSFMLRGWYVERVHDGGAVARKAPSVAFRRARIAHRIEAVGRDCTTLMLYGGRFSPWKYLDAPKERAA